MQFPYYYTPVAGNYSPAERDAMFGKIKNADTPGNLASYNGVLALAPRPNLLDNAYFVGGTGYGVFPVNQRGQLSYSNAWSIDRWFSGGTLNITDDGITYSGQYINLIQKLASGAAVVGKTVTVSALLDSGFFSEQIDVPDLPASGDVFARASFQTFSIVIGVNSYADVRFYFQPQTADVFKIRGFWMEEGNVQTAAHQESGVWVPNKIPRYDDELRKCQAYLQIIKPTGTEMCLLGSGYVNSEADTKRALFPVPLSVPMRPITSVTSTGVAVIQTGVGTKNIDAIALFCQTTTLVTLNTTLTTAISSPPYAALTAYVRSSGSVIISSESN